MADLVTMNISECIKQMGINISALSRRTGVSDGILRRSVVSNDRDLRAEEFMAICNAIGKNPFDFYQAPTELDGV